MQLRRAITLTVGGVWGEDPDEINDLGVARVADFDMELLMVKATPTKRAVATGQRGRRLLRPGDLLLEKSGGGEKQNVGRLVEWRGTHEAVCSNFISLLRPAPWCAPRYLVYLSRALYQHGWANSCTKQTTGIQNLDVSAYLAAEMPAIPRDQQRQIAAFLDRECDRIGAALASSERLAAAMTTAMEVRVPEAVADLPRLRLRFGWRVTDCKHRTPAYLEAEGGFPVVSTREVIPGSLVIDAETRRVSEEDFHDLRSGGRLPREGDIIYSRNARLGVAALVVEDQQVCMGQDVVLISRAHRGSQLLAYVLNFAVADQVRLAAIGSTFERINVPVIRNLEVPTADAETEAGIVNYLDGLSVAVTRAETRGRRSVWRSPSTATPSFMRR